MSTLDLGVRVVSASIIPATNSIAMLNGSTHSATITLSNPTTNPLTYRVTLALGPASGMTAANLICSGTGNTAQIAPGAQGTVTIPVIVPSLANTTEGSAMHVLGALRIQEATTNADLVGNTTFPYLTDASWDITLNTAYNVEIKSMLIDSQASAGPITMVNGTSHIIHVKIKNNAVNPATYAISTISLKSSSTGSQVATASGSSFGVVAAGAEVTKDITIVVPNTAATPGSPLSLKAYFTINDYNGNVLTPSSVSPSEVTVIAVEAALGVTLDGIGHGMISINGATIDSISLSSTLFTLTNPTVNPLTYIVYFAALPIGVTDISQAVFTMRLNTELTVPAGSSRYPDSNVTGTLLAGVPVLACPNRNLSSYLGYNGSKEFDTAVRVVEKNTNRDLLGTAVFPWVIQTGNPSYRSAVLWDWNFTTGTETKIDGVLDPVTGLIWENGSSHTIKVKVTNDGVNSNRYIASARVTRVSGGALTPSSGFPMGTSSLTQEVAPGATVFIDIPCTIRNTAAAAGAPVVVSISISVYTADDSGNLLGLSGSGRYHAYTAASQPTITAQLGGQLIGVTWS